MNLFKQIPMLGLFIALLSSCSSWQLSHVAPSQYRVQDSISQPEIHALIAPYKAHTDSLMNEVIGSVPFDLEKGRPNGNLGFWMADAVRVQASMQSHQTIDLALLNNGGVRRPYIKKGEVTLGMMYELMPFDNQLVLLEVNGELVKQMVALMAAKGGDPVSGLRLEIHSQDTSIYIGGKRLVEEARYTLVSNDYMYNGGDGYGLLQEGKNLHYQGLIRDALIEEMKNPNAAFPMEGERRIQFD